MKIIGIDPGLRNMGWGVIAVDGPRLRHLANGIVHSAAGGGADGGAGDLGPRLVTLYRGLRAVIAEYAPDAAAVEQTFVNKDAVGTLKLGQARAAVMLAPARCGLSVAEYSPNLIKKAVVGAGHADKTQIAFMVKRLLPTCGEVKADAADALAVAITHAQLRRFSSLSRSDGEVAPQRSGGGGGALAALENPSVSSRRGSLPPPHRFAAGRRQG